WWTDGMTSNLGAFPDGDAIAADMGRDHDAALFGNEMYPWGVPLSSPAMALRQNGINIGRRLWLLRFLLKPDIARDVLRDYRGQYEALMDAVDPGSSPEEICD